MDRSKAAYEHAIKDLQRYVDNPNNNSLDWNTIQLVKDYKSTCGSLGEDARKALDKYYGLEKKYQTG